MREYILADSGFQPTSWCITPFDMKGIEGGMSLEMLNYNKRISKVRVKVECALGYLKKRFPLIRKSHSYGESALNKIFYACCVLQNFILSSGEPLEYGALGVEDFETFFETDEENAINLECRNTLIDHFWENKF